MAQKPTNKQKAEAYCSEFMRSNMYISEFIQHILDNEDKLRKEAWPDIKELQVKIDELCNRDETDSYQDMRHLHNWLKSRVLNPVEVKEPETTTFTIEKPINKVAEPTEQKLTPKEWFEKVEDEELRKELMGNVHEYPYVFKMKSDDIWGALRIGFVWEDTNKGLIWKHCADSKSWQPYFDHRNKMKAETNKESTSNSTFTIKSGVAKDFINEILVETEADTLDEALKTIKWMKATLDTRYPTRTELAKEIMLQSILNGHYIQPESRVIRAFDLADEFLKQAGDGK